MDIVHPLCALQFPRMVAEARREAEKIKRSLTRGERPNTEILEGFADWTKGDWEKIKPRAPEVIFPDMSVASIMATSERSKQEFAKEQPRGVAYAASMGRFVQDPLLELACLWPLSGAVGGLAAVRDTKAASLSDYLSSYHLHPLQAEVAPSVLARSAERVMVEASCVVGVNLLEARRRPHQSPILQFIGGLGPRKASALLEVSLWLPPIPPFALPSPYMSLSPPSVVGPSSFTILHLLPRAMIVTPH